MLYVVFCGFNACFFGWCMKPLPNLQSKYFCGLFY